MPKHSKRHVKPYLVLVISVVLSVIAGLLASRYSAQQDRLKFEQMADAQETRISEKLRHRIALLQGLAGLIASRADIKAEEFQAYTARAEFRAYPDLQAIGYIPRLNKSGSDSYPVIFLEPSKGNERLFGMNLLADPMLRSALESARDTGLPAISDRWIGFSDEPVILIFDAAYSPAASTQTVEQRREAIQGLVLELIRPSQLFKNESVSQSGPALLFRAFNGNAIDSRRLLYSNAVVSDSDTAFSTRRTISVPGATWSVMFTAPPAVSYFASRAWIAFILAIGGCISFLLFFVTRSDARARAECEESAEQLGTAKKIQEQLNAKLEQHRTKLKELISQMPGIVWEMAGRPGTPLKFTFISDYVETMLGYPVGEWIETPTFWLTVIHPSDRDRAFRDITQVFQTGAGGTKFRWIAKDGKEVWVETHAAVLTDERGEIIGLRGVTMDITARHHAEETLRDREVRLQIALSAVRMASWHWDLISGSLMWDDVPYTWTDFVRRLHPDDQVSIRSAVDNALREQQDLDFEFRIVQPDNTIRWVALKAKVFQGPDGRPAYITGVSIDVTDRRKAAEALRASEERYRLAARATNDAIWDWDLTTGLVQWNEGIRTLFGYPADQVGTDVTWRFNQIHPDDRERVVSGFNAVIEGGGRFWSDEYQFRCANGSYATVNDRAYIEHNDYGKAIRLIAAITDVTRLKQAEREREQLLRLEHTARKQAESANRVKDDFIATLSHELRTPLTPILGWTELLRHRSVDAGTLQRGIDVIEQNARSQAKLIDDLLDLSRIVTGKMQVKIQTLDVQPIIQAAIDAMQPAAEAKGIRIETITDRSSAQLAADPDRLQQVFWNLLSNAIKFTPSGGAISVSSAQAGGEMRVVVQDSGEGIDPEFLPHVFDRFSQADSTNVRTHGGLGIGLALVRYIVELHGGRVAVTSQGKGLGSCFTVTLPLKTAEAKPRTKRSKRVTKAPFTLKDLRLLIVDDDPDVRELLALVLEQEGAIVSTAASAREAIELLESNSLDILISDIAMPEENGYVLLRKLREIERQQARPQMPAIALSAYAREEDRKNSSEAGFEVHLTKPIEAEKLISSIISVASRHLGKAS